MIPRPPLLTLTSTGFRDLVRARLGRRNSLPDRGAVHPLTGREPLDREWEGLTLEVPAQGGQAFRWLRWPRCAIERMAGFFVFSAGERLLID